ncbi:MAG: hypothetical protein JRM97_06640 [Nitrososphaerota archaeon]|nr:hypothetical protein [Nitrososphaerota archaeon]MDG7032287.1 hypothetical protein [Nitrososphaerota archaeon]
MQTLTPKQNGPGNRGSTTGSPLDAMLWVASTGYRRGGSKKTGCSR